MSVLVGINHSTGDLTQYTTTVTDGGNLSCSSDAALGGSNYGLSCLINDTTAIYGQKTFSFPTPTTRARFYIDPNGLSIPDNNAFSIFRFCDSSGLNPIYRVELEYKSGGGGYRILTTAITDAAGETYRVSAISDAPHYVELLCTRAATNVSADGTFELWIDGTQVGTTVTGIDNYDRWALNDRLRLGAVISIDATTAGTLYLDELVVNDDGGEIGPVGGTTYTLAADAGSYILTGNAAELKHSITGYGRYDIFSAWRANRRLNSITTQSALRWSILPDDYGANNTAMWRDWLNLQNGITYTIDLVTGVYNLTGQDAALNRTINLDAVSGDYTLTGNDATFPRTYRYTLDCDAGAYTLTGNDATLSWSGDVPAVVTGGGIPLWAQLFKQQRAIIDEEEEMLVMAMMML